jgi:hypothetical protein
MQFPVAVIKAGEIVEVVRSAAAFYYGEGDDAVLHPAGAWELWSADDWTQMCPEWEILPLTENPPASPGKKVERKSETDWLIQADHVEVTYQLVDLTPDELEASKPRVPQTVTNFQARAALLNAGLFEQVNEALMSLPISSTERQAWEYANELTRNGALVNSVAEALGLTSAQLDDLFRQASRIEA